MYLEPQITIPQDNGKHPASPGSNQVMKINPAPQPHPRGLAQRFSHLIGVLLSAAIHLSILLLIIYGITTRPTPRPLDRVVTLSLTEFNTMPAEYRKKPAIATKPKPVNVAPVNSEPVHIKPVKHRKIRRRKIRQKNKPHKKHKKVKAKPRIKKIPVAAKQQAVKLQPEYQQPLQTLLLHKTVNTSTSTPSANTAIKPSPSVSHALSQLKQQYRLRLRQLITRAKKYPRQARHRHQQGTVKIAFTVYANGSIHNIRVIQSSSSRLLDNSAIRTIRHISGVLPFPAQIHRQQWRFILPLVYRLY